MRVLHVITRLVVGGAQENTIASVLGLRRLPGLEVALVSGPTTGAEGSLADSVAEPGLLTLAPHLVRPVHPWKDWLAFRELTRIFRGWRPDLVHTHSGKAGILGRAAAARAGVPLVLHTVHGPSFGPFQGALANAAFRAAERWAARHTTHLVSVADAMTREYLAAGIGRPELYTTVRSGFDVEAFARATNDPALRRQFGLAESDFVIGKVARLFKLKGHDDLFAVAPEVVRAVPTARFLLVGDGPWRERFAARGRASGLAGHFVFAGLVPPGEMPRCLGVMDALIHLSSREGLPRSVSQALAAGKPVVAYDCSGVREVVADGDTGFLLAPGDRRTLSARLLELARQPELRTRLGLAGQARIRREFTVEKMVTDLHKLYGKLARARGVKWPPDAARAAA